MEVWGLLYAVYDCMALGGLLCGILPVGAVLVKKCDC